jgi:hypothetical protein
MNEEIKGFNEHRLRPDDSYHAREVAMHQTFFEMYKYRTSADEFFEQLVNLPRGTVTPHDEQVVCSVIQWLGTPVGQGFLEQAMAKSAELQAGLRQKSVTPKMDLQSPDAEFAMHM